MKPEHETRRKIIREWRSLPKDKRQTEGRSGADRRSAKRCAISSEE